MIFSEKEQHNINSIVDNLSGHMKVMRNIHQIIELIPDDNEILLLGECTHGTQEFYDIRSQLTQELMIKKGYNVILLEAEWPDIYRVNKYVINESRDQSAIEALGNIKEFPKWLWKNRTITDLVEEVRKWNIISGERDPNRDPVYIFGIDCQQIYRSYKSLKNFLETYDISYSFYFNRLLSFLKNYENEQEYARSVVYGKLRKLIGDIPDILQDFLSNYQWEKVEEYIKNYKDINVSLLDIISSEQNAEIIVNGEEYFRKMLLEPPGSQASWNTRDQHMLTTIMKLRNRLEDISATNKPPKIIVWAHNSHIGNSIATNRGGQDFTHNNTWNLGQMVKETFPKSKSIGFYTYNGTVTAATPDNTSHTIYELSPPPFYSYEFFFHQVAKKLNKNKLFMNLETYRDDLIKNIDINDIAIQPINVLYKTIHKNCILTKEIELDSPIINDNLEEGFLFMPIERVISKKGIVRLKLADGGWITEYNKYGNITLHCLPVDKILSDNIINFLNNNLLQRWVGVKYCKNTEIESHYGNSNIAKQYDNIIFIDNTNALEYIED